MSGAVCSALLSSALLSFALLLSQGLARHLPGTCQAWLLNSCFRGAYLVLASKRPTKFSSPRIFLESGAMFFPSDMFLKATKSSSPRIFFERGANFTSSELFLKAMLESKFRPKKRSTTGGSPISRVSLRHRSSIGQASAEHRSGIGQATEFLNDGVP